MPPPVAYEECAADSRGLQLQATALYSLLSDADRALGALCHEATAAARAERAACPTLASVAKAVRALAAFVPGDDVEQSSADASLRLSVTILQCLEDQRAKLAQRMEQKFAEEFEQFHKQEIDVAKTLRNEYRARSNEFWRRLEKAIGGEMTPDAEKELGLLRRTMAEAAARYARHLNHFRVRSKAILAKKALALISLYKTHYHECSKLLRSYDKELARHETGLEQVNLQAEREEKLEDEHIEKLMELAGSREAAPDDGRERRGWLYLQASWLGGLGAAWTKYWCVYNTASRTFKCVHPDKSETETVHLPITEQIFSKDIGGRHNVFKVSQANPNKDLIFQALSSEDRKAWINIMKGYAPVKSTRRRKGKDKTRAALTPQSVAFLQKLITHVEATGLDEVGLYRIPGQHSRYQKLYSDVMEKGKAVSLAEEDIATVASTIKYFFKQLSEPLFTPATYDRVIAAANEKDESEKLRLLREALGALPASNRQVVRWLFHHLATVASHAKTNNMDASNLGRCFGPTLLRCEDDSPEAFSIIHIQGHAVELLVKYYDVLLAGQDDVVVTFEEADTAAETPAEESGDTGGRLAPHRPAPPSPVALAKMSGSTRRHGSSTDLGGAAGGSTSATNQQHFLPTSAHAPSAKTAAAHVGPTRSRRSTMPPGTTAVQQPTSAGPAMMPPGRPPQPVSLLPPPPAQLLDGETPPPPVLPEGGQLVAPQPDGVATAVVTPPAEDEAVPERIVRALYNCEADADEEISFKQGQVIVAVVTAPSEDGWLLGTVQDTGERGLFPSNFVVTLDSAEA